jgi:protein-disulfide isomerase
VVGTEPALKENYIQQGQVQLVFNPMLDHGDRSLQAHQAAECAGEQEQFWAMHDLIFERQRELFGGDIRESLKGMAAELGLDSEQFNRCLDEQRYSELVQSQDERRRQLGIRTRPTFDINGQLIVGAQPFDVFQSVLEPLLAE